MFARRRPLLRAAAVGGGAYMAGRSAARRQAEQQEQDDRIRNLEAQAAYQQVPAQQGPEPAQPPAAPSPMLDQLNQLAALHQQGMLNDEEFAAAKAKLLRT